FGELAKQNPDIDHEVDRRQTQFAKDNDNIIIESRLSGWFVENADIKILLTASQKCRSERIAEREGLTPEKSYELTVEREACEALRYREYYGIDILSTEPFDLVISTELFNQDEVLAISSAAVDCLLKK
ncbi:MAG TPA: cytidylate kinase family protein, partial [Methanocorpusculum sp.]|nr:cytidylate kinase family protein [Methanocorpusculum sp.]